MLKDTRRNFHDTRQLKGTRHEPKYVFKESFMYSPGTIRKVHFALHLFSMHGKSLTKVKKNVYYP